MSDKLTRSIEALEERIQRNLGRAMFAARWIMAPIYVGLLVALLMIVVKFVQKLVTAIPGFLALSSNEAIFLVLTLVDLSLVANLVVIVIFAGWENFVGRLLASQHERPHWLGGLDFGAIKLRLIASIAAIAAILILETFVHIGEVPYQYAAWQLAILLGIGVLGVLLALADRLTEPHDREK
ncbi:MAG TPA: YqhA family protein [Acetobacteraceae bacterium]|nr:YqhA family protein [Acetobacteraceae bacterium]